MLTLAEFFSLPLVRATEWLNIASPAEVNSLLREVNEKKTCNEWVESHIPENKHHHLGELCTRAMEQDGVTIGPRGDIIRLKGGPR